MNCPVLMVGIMGKKCLHRDTKVVDSRSTVKVKELVPLYIRRFGKTAVFRRRECKFCGLKFPTVELSFDDMKELIAVNTP